MRNHASILLVPFLLACGAMTFADAPLIFCDCHACDWQGGRYAYTVDAVSYPVIEFVVGTADLNRTHYTNVVTPAGWQFEVTAAQQTNHARGAFTPHGTVSPGASALVTDGVVRWWTDDPNSAVEMFTFAYDHPWPAEDVGWCLQTRRPGPPPSLYAFTEFWDSPVGMGEGPLHGPYAGDWCWANGDCGEEYYCWFHDCAAETGRCRKRPYTCPYLWAPVCGCDQATYANACDAAYMGMSVAYPWACDAGDLNHDGYVGLDDVEQLCHCLFGPGSAFPLLCADADINFDGSIDLVDVRIVQIMFRPAGR